MVYYTAVEMGGSLDVVDEFETLFEATCSYYELKADVEDEMEEVELGEWVQFDETQRAMEPLLSVRVGYSFEQLEEAYEELWESTLTKVDDGYFLQLNDGESETFKTFKELQTYTLGEDDLKSYLEELYS